MNNPITPEAKFAELFKQMYALCDEHGWGDPFNYARAREIYMANFLGHTIAPTLSGADAFEDKEMTKPLEYKATVQDKINATYNGISVKSSWEEQLKYLKKEKICKYEYHYFARFNGAEIKELYKMSGDKVYDYLVPKLKKKYDKKNKGADPRLGANIVKNYIIANSEKIFSV